MTDDTLLGTSQYVNITPVVAPPPRAIKAYHEQRGSAKRRRIAWEFTFAEWWAWWQRDGNWERRGKRRGQLVMARFGDAGPYSPTNVFAATPFENWNDREPANYQGTGELIKQKWAARTPEQNAHLPVFQVGERHPRARPVLTPAGRFGTAREAAEHYGIHHGSASKKAAQRHGGWMYEDEATGE